MKITTCPTCGSRRIKRVRRSVRGEIRGRAYDASGVSLYECPDCGEKVYDRDAMKKIEAARSRVRSSRRTATR